MDPSKKRELRNSYKNKPAVGAVYQITCSGNQRSWIKSTVDIAGIQSRFNFSMMMKGCPEPSMNREWSQYGSESFSLTVLEELTMKEGQTAREFADDIRLLYEMWLDKTAPASDDQ